MKRLWAILLFIAVGILCGVAISVLNLAFEPKYCGEDCASTALASLVTWTGICIFVFPSIGLMVWVRTGKTPKSLAVTTVVLALLSTLPFVSIYVYRLHISYWKDEWKRHIPNVDFSFMIIATKPVTAIVGDTGSSIQIKPWERCVFGPVDCDQKPHNLEALCLGNGRPVLIGESAWPAFQRIPEEDLQGLIDRPKDMRLCEER